MLLQGYWRGLSIGHAAQEGVGHGVDVLVEEVHRTIDIGEVAAGGMLPAFSKNGLLNRRAVPSRRLHRPEYSQTATKLRRRPNRHCSSNWGRNTASSGPRARIPGRAGHDFADHDGVGGAISDLIDSHTAVAIEYSDLGIHPVGRFRIRDGPLRGTYLMVPPDARYSPPEIALPVHPP